MSHLSKEEANEARVAVLRAWRSLTHMIEGEQNDATRRLLKEIRDDDLGAALEALDL